MIMIIIIIITIIIVIVILIITWNKCCILKATSKDNAVNKLQFIFKNVAYRS